MVEIALQNQCRGDGVDALGSSLWCPAEARVDPSGHAGRQAFVPHLHRDCKPAREHLSKLGHASSLIRGLAGEASRKADDNPLRLLLVHKLSDRGRVLIVGLALDEPPRTGDDTELVADGVADPLGPNIKRNNPSQQSTLSTRRTLSTRSRCN